MHCQLGEHESGELRVPMKLAPLPPPLVTAAFATSVLRYQFDDDDAVVLADAAASAFAKFAATQPAGTHPQRLNNDFFDHQTAAREKLFDRLPTFQRLQRRVRAAAAYMLMQHGVPHAEALRRASTRRIDGWVSVHSKGSAHSRHSHVASAISCVYYSRVPSGSGRIRFHDPRGEHKIMQQTMIPHPRYGEAAQRGLLPLPPFRRSYSVDVREGLLVCFPSWLLHEVEESSAAAMPDGAHRISWAFNIAGDWHETNDLTIELNTTTRGGRGTVNEHQAVGSDPQQQQQRAGADEPDDGAFGYGAARARHRDEL